MSPTLGEELPNVVVGRKVFRTKVIIHNEDAEAVYCRDGDPLLDGSHCRRPELSELAVRLLSRYESLVLLTSSHSSCFLLTYLFIKFRNRIHYSKLDLYLENSRNGNGGTIFSQGQ